MWSALRRGGGDRRLGRGNNKNNIIDTTINDPSQGAEDRGGDLLSIRLNAEAEDKFDKRGGRGDDPIEDRERVD